MLINNFIQGQMIYYYGFQWKTDFPDNLSTEKCINYENDH